MEHDAAIQRWLLGHHVFFLMLQGLVINHDRLLRALRSGDRTGAILAFRRATQLLDGSAGAMRLAGHMSPESYDQVRETMTPPNVPDGFSGIWSRDHQLMMEGLRHLRQEILTLDPELAPEHREWVEALDRVYAAHALVCERFVGNGPSLALSRAKTEAGTSAVASLQNFRARTLALAVAPHALIDTVEN